MVFRVVISDKKQIVVDSKEVFTSRTLYDW